jgi:hypothetical protein
MLMQASVRHKDDKDAGIIWRQGQSRFFEVIVVKYNPGMALQFFRREVGPLLLYLLFIKGQ